MKNRLKFNVKGPINLNNSIYVNSMLRQEHCFLKIFVSLYVIDISKMAWFKREKKGIITSTEDKKETPDGMWNKCPSCKKPLHYAEQVENKYGSMGSVVGEKIARSIDYSIKNKIPFMMISKSGGARMMEAAFSLMQMAKTSAKLALLSKAKIPYISLLTDPTTGGVTASYAMLGDINISEPGALIGFAGPRVIKETIKKDLPKGFQTSEFVLEHGFLDFIVDRRQMKTKLGSFLRMLIS